MGVLSDAQLRLGTGDQVKDAPAVSGCWEPALRRDFPSRCAAGSGNRKCGQRRSLHWGPGEQGWGLPRGGSWGLPGPRSPPEVGTLEEVRLRAGGTRLHLSPQHPPPWPWPSSCGQRGECGVSPWPPGEQRPAPPWLLTPARGRVESGPAYSETQLSERLSGSFAASCHHPPQTRMRTPGLREGLCHPGLQAEWAAEPGARCRGFQSAPSPLLVVSEGFPAPAQMESQLLLALPPHSGLSSDAAASTQPSGSAPSSSFSDPALFPFSAWCLLCWRDTVSQSSSSSLASR